MKKMTFKLINRFQKSSRHCELHQKLGNSGKSWSMMLLLTSALAFSSLMAGDQDDLAVPEGGAAENQTRPLTFQKNGKEFIPEMRANRITLDLHNNHLTGEIPEAIGRLVNLQHLYLYNNRLTGEIPKEIGNLTDLSTLYLHNNHLTGEIPEGLWGLPNLQSLNLHSNTLFGQRIMTKDNRKIDKVNIFCSVKTEEEPSDVCIIDVTGEAKTFHSHFTDDGVWQEELIEKTVQFTYLSIPLQALLIAELANYGYAQEMRFEFSDDAGVLMIGSGEFGPRVITVSDPRLNTLKTALENLHMPLGEFRMLAEKGQHPIGLIHLEQGKQTKSANKI